MISLLKTGQVFASSCDDPNFKAEFLDGVRDLTAEKSIAIAKNSNFAVSATDRTKYFSHKLLSVKSNTWKVLCLNISSDANLTKSNMLGYMQFNEEKKVYEVSLDASLNKLDSRQVMFHEAFHILQYMLISYDSKAFDKTKDFNLQKKFTFIGDRVTDKDGKNTNKLMNILSKKSEIGDDAKAYLQAYANTIACMEYVAFFYEFHYAKEIGNHNRISKDKMADAFINQADDSTLIDFINGFYIKSYLGAEHSKDEMDSVINQCKATGFGNPLDFFRKQLVNQSVNILTANAGNGSLPSNR